METEWMTDEIRHLIWQIEGPYIGKKRATVVMVAFAKVNGYPLRDLFRKEALCAESIWWGKWSKNPVIRASVDAIQRRVRETADMAELSMTSDEWITDEIKELLEAIPGPYRTKKQTTVVLIAFAEANGDSITAVFDRDDTCAESIWWGKWSKDPVILAPLEACKKRALDWTFQQLVHKAEETYREQIRTLASVPVENRGREAEKKRLRKELTRILRTEYSVIKARLALQLMATGKPFECAMCGGYQNMSIDHIVPLSKGGTNDMDNLQWLCRSCNSRKGDRVVHIIPERRVQEVRSAAVQMALGV